MRKPTPSEIKANGVLGERFFSRGTMRFFGQRMSDFKTEWHDLSRWTVRLYAPMYMGMGGKRCGTTERFIDVCNWEEVNP